MREFKIGDKVFHCGMGKGVVVDLANDRDTKIPVCVEFDSVEFNSINPIKKRKWFTKEGFSLREVTPTLFHEDENPIITQRVIEVSNSEGAWGKRVCIYTNYFGAICWEGISELSKVAIEMKKERLHTTLWPIWREVQEEKIVELTFEDISNGKGVGVPKHLIRIKE